MLRPAAADVSLLSYANPSFSSQTKGTRPTSQRAQGRLTDLHHQGAANATATSVPSLRQNAGHVKPRDVGRIMAWRPKDVWAMWLAVTYLLDGKHFKPLEVVDKEDGNNDNQPQDQDE